VLKALSGSEIGIPVLAVDIGYSASNRSCGLCWEAKSCRLRFGDCVTAITRVIEEAVSPRVVLVIEAPLSVYHNPATGNPSIRGQFEKDRGWYYGPGAVTCLAAQRLLSCVDAAVHREVLVAEAFFSNQPRRTPHDEVATLIHDDFWHVEPSETNDGVVPLPPLQEYAPPIRVFQPR